MKRIETHPRNNWQSVVEQLGFGFHTTNVPYWDESAFYQFTLQEVLDIETATEELWRICLLAVQYAIDAQLLKERFGIPSEFIPLIERSWKEDHPSLFGRFDLCYRDGLIKMLEFNADTPTSLYEAGIVQWFWLQDFDPSKDQFNSIHEKLIDYLNYLRTYLYPGALHFSCVKGTLEDLTNTEYLRDCAIQAGIATKLIFIDDIGWDLNNKQLVDTENKPIKSLFKLYPWEWMIREEFGMHLLIESSRPLFIEPAWKMILSNKAILPLLWELFPGHPHLLAAYMEDHSMSGFVKKPILSREGSNISMVSGGETLAFTEGPYGDEKCIYQELFQLPEYVGKYPLIGSWVIGQKPAGMGIRESDGLITDNSSRFLPHLIE
jgi:glutathionylspermidine synthase